MQALARLAGGDVAFEQIVEEYPAELEHERPQPPTRYTGQFPLVGVFGTACRSLK